MGLSARKTKQRIGPDPRNLAWADDASTFGATYLAKFGWDASQGLGPAGDGRATHIKVAQKLDMLGVGGQGSDPEAMQTKDFEGVLKRLNVKRKREDEAVPSPRPVPRHRAHRARHIAAKRSTTASSMSEILAVGPTAPQPVLTPTADDEHKITTSTKSVADYFKERLQAKHRDGDAIKRGA